LPIDLAPGSQTKTLDPDRIGYMPEHWLYSTESLTVDMAAFHTIDFTLHAFD
jgi:hypothetical protein